MKPAGQSSFFDQASAGLSTSSVNTGTSGERFHQKQRDGNEPYRGAENNYGDQPEAHQHH